MTDLDSPRQNHLLNALPAAEYERLFPHLEQVPMPLGKVLYESGDELHHAYFPTTCIVSKLYVMENGAITLEDRAENLLSNEDVKKAYLGM